MVGDLTTISLIFGIVMILSFALMGRIGARKVGFPPVFGELLTGILIGNLFYYWGYDLIVVLREGTSCVDIAELALSGHTWDDAVQMVLGDEAGGSITELLQSQGASQYLQIAQAVDLFLRYSLIFIMFHIGLGTYVIAQLRSVESDSFKVAVIGAFAPMLLGFAVIILFGSSITGVGHIYIAATLGTTGMIVTSHVLTRLRKINSSEARIILGAAVMDDVLGLVMLAIASGIALSGSAALDDIARTTIRASLFLVCAFGLGPVFLKYLISMLHRLDVIEAKLFVSFILVMLLAGLATFVGLSPIVGAFAAGLLMHESHFTTWGDRQKDKHTIRELFTPLEVIIVPAFFVLMGMQVRLETLLDLQAVYIFVCLLAAAAIGKWVSGFGARGEVNRMAIGIGMMPRGEVGLAFAFIGKSMGIIDATMFTVIVLVVVTTLIMPLMMRMAFRNDSYAAR